jgi:hypothetical protein
MFRNLLTRAQNSKRQDRRSFNPQVPGSSPGGGTRRAGRRGARDASPESHPAREGPQPEPYGFGPSSPYLSRGRCLCSPRGCSQFALPHRAWQERRAPGWICRSARGCSGSSPGCVLFLIVFFNLRYIKRRNEQARWGSRPPPPQVSSSCPARLPFPLPRHARRRLLVHVARHEKVSKDSVVDRRRRLDSRTRHHGNPAHRPAMTADKIGN